MKPHWRIKHGAQGAGAPRSALAQQPAQYFSTNIVNDNKWQLLPTINLLVFKIRSLNSVFSLLLGLKQPSSSACYLQERVYEGRGPCFGVMAKDFARAIDLAPSSFKS